MCSKPMARNSKWKQTVITKIHHIELSRTSAPQCCLCLLCVSLPFAAVKWKVYHFRLCFVKDHSTFRRRSKRQKSRQDRLLSEKVSHGEGLLPTVVFHGRPDVLRSHNLPSRSTSKTFIQKMTLRLRLTHVLLIVKLMKGGQSRKLPFHVTLQTVSLCLHFTSSSVSKMICNIPLRTGRNLNLKPMQKIQACKNHGRHCVCSWCTSLVMQILPHHF